jgi:hypothetical protein
MRKESKLIGEPFVYIGRVSVSRAGDVWIFARVNGPDYKWYYLSPVGAEFTRVLANMSKEPNKVVDKGE